MEQGSCVIRQLGRRDFFSLLRVVSRVTRETASLGSSRRLAVTQCGWMMGKPGERDTGQGSKGKQDREVRVGACLSPGVSGSCSAAAARRKQAGRFTSLAVPDEAITWSLGSVLKLPAFLWFSRSQP